MSDPANTMSSEVPIPEEATDGYTVHKVTLNLCEACIDGEGEECHTPGCDLFPHAVDIPILPAREQIADRRMA
jgi:hypothetical protein